MVFKIVLESFAELYVLAPYTKLYTSLVIPFKIKSPYKSDKIIVLLKDLKVFSFLLFPNESVNLKLLKLLSILIVLI